MRKLDAFIKLSDLFNEHGYKLYLVGGSVRDYLLFNNIDDLDVVTDATPDNVKSFFNEKARYDFARFGAVTLYYDDFKFDLTTLREESIYDDSRHPSEIKFINDLKVDVKRRDFTINALYMDKYLTIYDYVDGKKDLKNKIIKIIGNPDVRLKEDPLRILRAIRFMIRFDFKIDAELEYSMRKNIKLLDNLNPNKIKEEIKKMDKNIDELAPIFDNFNILYLIDMIK